MDSRLVRFGARARPRVRLVAFPFAGGAASAFRRLADALPPAIELVAVQPAGREHRFREATLTDFASVVDDALQALGELDAIPQAFFGHSLGALVAFETSRTLRRLGKRLPVRLFVSSSLPPSRARDKASELAGASDATLLAWLARQDGFPMEVLASNPFCEQLLTVVRADIQVLITHEYVNQAPLPVGIVAFGGRSDNDVPFASMKHWSLHTEGTFSAYAMEGGHFYFRGRESQVATLLQCELEDVLA